MSKTQFGMDRRSLLSGLAGVGAGIAACGPTILRPAFAQGKKFAGTTVTFASWGGPYQDAGKTAYCDPFEQKFGGKVLQDTPANYSKVRTTLMANSPVWDVLDVISDFFFAVVDDGVFRKIDTSIVDTKRIDPKFVHEYGVGNHRTAYVLGYNTNTYSESNRPRTWADLFDLKKFPGKRMFRDRVDSSLEIALLGDGVPPDKLYPLDVDRAFKKLDTIKKDTLFYAFHSQAQQWLTSGEVTLGNIVNARIYDAAMKGAKVAAEWNQNLVFNDYLVVPKGSRNPEAAMHIINEMTYPENQAKFAELIASAPTNPDAYKFIKPDLIKWMINPENGKTGILMDETYWHKTLNQLTERWTAWKVS